jgi:flagellar motor switch protein FliG
LIKKEHPQTVALILAHLPPLRAGEVLSLQPPQFQADILRRVAGLDAVSPTVVELVDQALLSDLAMMGKSSSKKIGGINLVADILNQMERSKEQSLMGEMEQADAELAESVRGLMFTFDDLLNLDGKSLQSLLKEVNRDSLVLSLKAADEDLKQHIFKNLSARAVEMIVEDMQNRGPVRLSDVEKAQADVVRVALQLTSSGVIQLSKGGEDAFV